MHDKPKYGRNGLKPFAQGVVLVTLIVVAIAALLLLVPLLVGLQFI